MIEVNIYQNGNLIELTAAKYNIHLFYNIHGVDLPPLRDYSFAIWHFLPLAITTSNNILIKGPCDSRVLQNAKRMVETWEMWKPHKYKYVEISATDEITPPPPLSNAKLTFFSGGVDSTHMLLRKGRQNNPAHLLTIHGMDYIVNENRNFTSLIRKTQALVESLNYHRIVLKTNAINICRGRHAWGMALAGHAFLFSGLYKGAVFASDSTIEQDFIMFPWGSNHVTNTYFQGSLFSVTDQCNDCSRTMKIAEIAKYSVALRSLSFCKIKALRPNNCGQCNWCLRAKAMFAVTIGEIPDIFMVPAFSNAEIFKINLRDKTERMNFVDIYQTARTSGRITAFPALHQRFAKEICNPIPHISLTKLLKWVSYHIKRIAPFRKSPLSR